MAFNGGRLTVSGKRRLGMAVFALLVTLFAFALLADPAWAQGQLDVEKTDNPDPVAQGEILTYTIVVENTAPEDSTGANDADDVTVTDNLPVGTGFISVTTTDGTCTEPPEGTDGTVTCDLNTLTPGEEATVTIQVEVEAAPGTEITNTASATCTPAGCVGDSDTIITTVVPDLEIQKLDDPDPVSTEELLLYQLRVQNQGSTILDPTLGVIDIDVTDELPLAQVDLVSFESEDFNCVFSAGLIQCDLTEPLSPGEVATVDIVVEPEEPGITLQNTAGVFFATATLPSTLVDEDTEDTEVEGGTDDSDGDGDGTDNGDNGDNGDDNGDDDNNDDDNVVEEVTVDETVDSGTTDEGGVLAESAVDPDEQAPVSEPQGNVVDEVATEGPLPNTGGMSILAVVLPIAGFLVLCLSIIHRINRNR